MSNSAKGLSSKSRSILELIAEGHGYEQILSTYPALTYPDIFRAAQEALEGLGVVQKAGSKRLADVRRAHSRAYEPWSAEEDGTLRKEFESGKGVKEIAGLHDRQPSAIRSRLVKLGLDPTARKVSESSLAK